MTETFQKLEQLKTLSDLIKSGRQADVAKARATERQIAQEVSQLRADRDREIRAADRLEDTRQLEVWLKWSSEKLTQEQARQARSRADLELRIDAFRKAFGRAAALDGLLEKERVASKQKRSRD